MDEKQIERSGCLTILLIVLIVLYLLGAVGSFLAGPLLSGVVPGYSSVKTISSGILALLNIIFLVGIWKYRKWGLYGFMSATAFIIVYSLSSGGRIFGTLLWAIPPVILFLLIKPIWNRMR